MPANNIDPNVEKALQKLVPGAEISADAAKGEILIETTESLADLSLEDLRAIAKEFGISEIDIEIDD